MKTFQLAEAERENDRLKMEIAELRGTMRAHGSILRRGPIDRETCERMALTIQRVLSKFEKDVV